MYDPKRYKSTAGHYNPVIDRSPVDQFGFVDLRKAYETGSIPGNATFLDEHSNGIVDPDDVMNRPKDNFERMRQMNYVKSALKSAAEAEAKQSTSDGGNE